MGISGTLRGQWVGQRLRELREANGFTVRDVAAYLQRSIGTVSRFETGVYPVRRGEVIALLALYGVNDPQQRNALLRLSEEVWEKGWWDGYANDVAGSVMDYAWLESRADEIKSFDISPIPGLLQSRDYAETLIRAADPDASEEQVERWLELRMTRQEVLTRSEPPRLSAIVDEAALRRAVGGPEVLVDQLRYLVMCARRWNVEVRVLPFDSGAYPNTAGPFSVLSMPEPFPEAGYVETPAGSIYIEEPDTARLVTAYDRLWEASLDADKSATLVLAMAEELE